MLLDAANGAASAISWKAGDLMDGSTPHGRLNTPWVSRPHCTPQPPRRLGERARATSWHLRYLMAPPLPHGGSVTPWRPQHVVTFKHEGAVAPPRSGDRGAPIYLSLVYLITRRLPPRVANRRLHNPADRLGGLTRVKPPIRPAGASEALRHAHRRPRGRSCGLQRRGAPARPAPYNVGMRRALYLLANALAGLVLVLLVIDPTRPITLIVVLLALAVVCAAVPTFLRRFL
jgi:hypothetical protein